MDSGAPPLPLNETMSDVALLIVGMLLGALGFSYVVGRYRARQLAKLADSLAEATSDTANAARPVRVADRVLSSSMERLQKRISEVEAMATTDQLTRLLNRLACLQVLSTEIERANRYDRQLAVAILDIDHFKEYNDTHGHLAGDEVLRGCARAWDSALRGEDTIVRFGGEEFLVLLPDTPPDQAAEIVERLRTQMPMGQTCSAGLACWDYAESIDDLLKRADEALYLAKAGGRDQVALAQLSE